MFDCLNGSISLQLIALAKTTKTNLQHVAGCLYEHFTGFMLQALYLLNSLEQRQAERLWLLGIDDWKLSWKIKQNAHSKVMVTSNSFYLYVHREPHHELHLSNCFDVGILPNARMQANISCQSDPPVIQIMCCCYRWHVVLQLAWVNWRVMPRTYSESQPVGKFKNRAGWTLRAVRREVEKNLAGTLIVNWRWLDQCPGWTALVTS